MASQAPGRPWFRLASLRSVAAPAPAPAPAQDPPPSSLVQPTNRINSSLPSSPAQKLPVHSSSSSSLPTSPLQNGSLSASFSVSSSSPIQKPSPPSSSSSPAKGGTSPSPNQVIQTVMQSQKTKPNMPPPPSASPAQKATTPKSASSTTKAEIMAARGSSSSTKQVVQTPMQSPKVKSTTPQPSPLTLPPEQLKANYEVKPKIPEEAVSKSVILQKRIEKPKQWANDNYSGQTQKNHNEKQNGNHRKSCGLENSPTKVITIAGENRGAYMELIQSAKKHEFGDKPSNYLHKNGESGNSSSDEGNVRMKENKNNRRTKSSHPMAAFMNSNVQCVNNSLLYNASCRSRSRNSPFSNEEAIRERRIPFQGDCQW